jgi:UDP-N-acetylglucosamine 2-epimerase
VKIAATVGARPNFVKIAPIVAALRTRPAAITTLIHTGQHYDGPMSDAFFANLELPDPDVNLHVKAASATAHAFHARRFTTRSCRLPLLVLHARPPWLPSWWSRRCPKRSGPI